LRSQRDGHGWSLQAGAVAGEPQQRRCRCFGPLNGGVGRMHNYLPLKFRSVGSGPRYRRIRRLGAGPRLLSSWRRVNWGRLSRHQFHGLIAAICGRERQSVPGAVRSHWRRRRFEALRYYETHFGPAPVLLREWQLRRGPAFYQSPEYQAWSQSAYDDPTPNPSLQETRDEAARP